MDNSSVSNLEEAFMECGGSQRPSISQYMKGSIEEPRPIRSVYYLPLTEIL